MTQTYGQVENESSSLCIGLLSLSVLVTVLCHFFQWRQTSICFVAEYNSAPCQSDITIWNGMRGYEIWFLPLSTRLNQIYFKQELWILQEKDNPTSRLILFKLINLIEAIIFLTLMSGTTSNLLNEPCCAKISYEIFQESHWLLISHPKTSSTDLLKQSHQIRLTLRVMVKSIISLNWPWLHQHYGKPYHLRPENSLPPSPAESIILSLTQSRGPQFRGWIAKWSQYF